MKAPVRLFAMVSGCGLAAALSGCVSGNPFAEAAVDPRSPVAADVARMANANQDFPAFSEIPAMPIDVRPPRAFGVAALEAEAARDRLERETAPGTWSLTGTETFASRAQIDAGPDAPPDGQDRRATEAFANELRKRATPPPPPKR